MTKKHFNALARQLATVRPSNTVSNDTQLQRYEQWCRCVAAVAAVCKFNNPAFSFDRFKEACNA